MTRDDIKQTNAAIVALEAALAQQPEPVQEPVAWMYTGIKQDGTEHGPHLVWKPAYMDAMSASKGAQATPLYTAPPPAEPVQEPVAWIQPDHLQKARVAPFLCRVEPTQRCADFVAIYTSPPKAEPAQEPVAQAMQDAAVYGVGISRDGKRIDPASIYAQPAQEQPEPVQEPVAWMTHGNDLLPLFHKTKAGALAWGAEPLPLYTSPSQRPLLTDEEMLDIIDAELEGGSLLDVARAVERKVRGETE